jgi:hypothetical protein
MLKIETKNLKNLSTPKTRKLECQNSQEEARSHRLFSVSRKSKTHRQWHHKELESEVLQICKNQHFEFSRKFQFRPIVQRKFQKSNHQKHFLVHFLAMQNFKYKKSTSKNSLVWKPLYESDAVKIKNCTNVNIIIPANLFEVSWHGKSIPAIWAWIISSGFGNGIGFLLLCC